MVVMDCLLVASELLISDLVDSSESAQAEDKCSNQQNVVSTSTTSRPGTVIFTVKELIEYVTFIISSVFFLEIMLKLLVSIEKFKKPSEIFDSIVVLITFGINLYLMVTKREGHRESVTGLINLLR
jgi:hypothetical protein